MEGRVSKKLIDSAVYPDGVCSSTCRPGNPGDGEPAAPVTIYRHFCKTSFRSLCQSNSFGSYEKQTVDFELSFRDR